MRMHIPPYPLSIVDIGDEVGLQIDLGDGEMVVIGFESVDYIAEFAAVIRGLVVDARLLPHKQRIVGDPALDRFKSRLRSVGTP